MSSPRDVDVEITSRCNLRCDYCFFFDNPAFAYRDLPTREWLQFFEELGACAVMRVCLGGGEPFARGDLPELLEGIVHNRMRFSILSNGGLVRDDVAALVARTGRCDSVQISVDGSCAEVHDRCRGPGSFAGAMAGIGILQRHGVAVTARVTVNRQNVQDLEAIARLLLEELGLPGFTTNSAGYLGSCQRNADRVLLTVPDRQRSMELLLLLSERYPGRLDAQAGPHAEARIWGEMERARRCAISPFPQGGRLTGCGCPWSKMAVRPDGVMVPCTMLVHLGLGRINRDPLDEVWRSAPALDRLRRRSEIALTGFELCSGCPYVTYCTGNCPGLAFALLGNVDHPSPDACLRAYLGQGGRLPGLPGDAVDVARSAG